eukprot:13325709-Ditylum_brightwellii.AAC.1
MLGQKTPSSSTAGHPNFLGIPNQESASQLNKPFQINAVDCPIIECNHKKTYYEHQIAISFKFLELAEIVLRSKMVTLFLVIVTQYPGQY